MSNWFFRMVRVAGAYNPASAIFVQLQAEIDSAKFEDRLSKIEDPLKSLHDDIAAVTEAIYTEFSRTDSVSLSFNHDFYQIYSRCLAILDSRGMISSERVMGSPIPVGLNLVDPSFILYMANLYEDAQKMGELLEIVDRCEVGVSIDAESLSYSIELPKYLIRAMFEVYESKGLGYRSGRMNKFRYTGKA